MSKLIRDRDVPTQALAGECVGILDYGLVGQSYALNIRDSGVKVLVAFPRMDDETERTRSLLQAEKIEVVEPAELVERADVLYLLVQDGLIRSAYEPLRARLRNGQALVVHTGFPLLYQLLDIPKFVDTLIVAPKAPGDAIRNAYVAKSGVPGLVAVGQDATGRARERALGLARAMGFTRVGVLETTVKDEVESDLMGEQLGWGLLIPLLRMAFDLLVERGYDPRLAYFEVFHEARFIVDTMVDGGFTGADGLFANTSDTARYGYLKTTTELMKENILPWMRRRADHITSGAFASEWRKDIDNGLKELRQMTADAKNWPLEKTGIEVRSAIKPSR